MKMSNGIISVTVTSDGDLKDWSIQAMNASIYMLPRISKYFYNMEQPSVRDIYIVVEENINI